MLVLNPIGRVISPITDRSAAPKQGDEGAPEAYLELAPEFADAATDLKVGQADSEAGARAIALASELTCPAAWL